jgi:hypothetical protein
VIHPSAGQASAPKVGRAFALDVDERRGQIVNTAFARKHARSVRQEEQRGCHVATETQVAALSN